MAAVLVFLAAIAIYVWTASPVMGWLDSPEFVAASASLGVSHSPGHPLPALLGKLCTLLPVGDVAFRVNLMSALATAGAAAALQRAARRLGDVIAPDLSGLVRGLSSVFIALGFAYSWAVWFQGARAEVYALQALFFTTALLGILAALTSQNATGTAAGTAGTGAGAIDGGAAVFF